MKEYASSCAEKIGENRYIQRWWRRRSGSQYDAVERPKRPDCRRGIDVYPYVEELTSRLIAEKDSFTMPRKYKVAIDTSVDTANYSYIADFGYKHESRMAREDSEY